MKPFNLERAIAGDPLITRDGREAVFIAYVPEADPSSMLLIRDELIIRHYFNNGSYSNTYSSSNDLFMAPVKRTLWQNLYTSGKGISWTGGVFKSEKDASSYQKVEQEPFAYVLLTENGNVRIWSKDRERVKKASEDQKLPFFTLFTHPPKVPDGWKLVPIKPTQEMIAAMRDQNMCGSMDNWMAYEEAIFAAPTPKETPK